MGSNKFSVLALFSFIMPASLQLAASMMFSVQRMANGPYGLLFALFVLFYRTCLRAGQHTLATTPLTLFLWFPTRRCCSKAATAVLVGVRYECVGQDSDILVWASGGLVVNANAPGLWFLIPAPCQQLMLNDGWSSFIPALTGIVAGLIFFSEAVPMSNVLIPAPIANFFSVCKKFAVHLWGREAVDHFSHRLCAVGVWHPQSTFMPVLQSAAPGEAQRRRARAQARQQAMGWPRAAPGGPQAGTNVRRRLPADVAAALQHAAVPGQV